MTTPIDIPETFTHICSFLDLEEFIVLTQLDSIRRNWIKTFPWSHITINIRSFLQLTHFITNYNFKCYHLTHTFFTNDHCKLLMSELNHGHKLFTKTFLSSRIIVKTLSVLPYDLCWFYLDHDYLLVESDTPSEPLVFSRNKMHLGYIETIIRDNILHVYNFSIWVKRFKLCNDDTEKKLLLQLCKIKCSDMLDYLNKFRQNKLIIDRCNYENCNKYLLDQLFSFICNIDLEHIHFLPKLCISIHELNAAFLNKISLLAPEHKAKTYLYYLLLVDKMPTIDDKDIVFDKNFFCTLMITSIVHLFTNKSIRLFIWDVICNNLSIPCSFSTNAARWEPRCRLKANIEYVKHEEMQFIMKSVLKNVTNWVNLELVQLFCECGNLEALQYIHDNRRCSKYLSTYDHLAFENIIKFNHHHILRWWIHSEWQIKVRQTRMLYRLLLSGQPETFKILLHSKGIIPFVFKIKGWNYKRDWPHYRHETYYRDWPRKFRRFITVLTTKDSSYVCNFVNFVNAYALSGVAESGNVQVLSMWYKYLVKKIKNLTPDGCICIQTAIENIFDSEYHTTIECAIKNDNLGIIEWWIRKLPFYYTCDAFNLACNLGHMDIVNFFLKNMQIKTVSKKTIERNIQVNGKWTKPFVLLYTIQGLTRIKNIALLHKMIKIWKDNDLLYGNLNRVETYLKNKFNLEHDCNLF